METTTLQIYGRNRNVDLTATDLIFTEMISVAEWEGEGAWLARADGAVGWWLGAFLVYGEDFLGVDVREYVEKLGFEMSTARNAKYVYRAVHPSRRRAELPFSLHAEVAPLDNTAQTRLLDEAIKNHWTRKELRAAVREYKRQLKKVDAQETGSERAMPEHEKVDPASAVDVMRQIVDLLTPDSDGEVFVSEARNLALEWLSGIEQSAIGMGQDADG